MAAGGDRTLTLTISVLFGVAALPVVTSLITDWARFPEAVAVAGALLALTSLLPMRLYAHVLSPALVASEPPCAGRSWCHRCSTRRSTC